MSLETCVLKDGVVRIQHLDAGDALGWSWLFPPYRWLFSAVTTAPTDVISFPAAALRKRAAEDIQFRSELLTRISRTLLQRLQRTRSQLVELHCLVLANSKGELANECKYQHQPVHG